VNIGLDHLFPRYWLSLPRLLRNGRGSSQSKSFTSDKVRKWVAIAAAVEARRARRVSILVLSFWLVFVAFNDGRAASLTGKVVAIADGDALTLVDASNVKHRIRLAGINAPEKSQPYGSESIDHLAALTLRKQVTVEWHKRDRYGRLLGRVFLKGQEVNLMQVAAGLAWHYKACPSDQSKDDRLLYAEAEKSATDLRAGLWKDPWPTPPWNSRKAVEDTDLQAAKTVRSVKTVSAPNPPAVHAPRHAPASARASGLEFK